MNKSVKLYQPPLLDFSKFEKCDEVKIVICNRKHKFATDAEASGTDIATQPIFGSKVYLNSEKISESTFGLPFMRFAQGSRPKITYHNKTCFTFNIHYHGLNTVGSVDGVASELIFGKGTLLGPKVTFQFPEITNNQTMLWFHSHNMFVSMELIYAGILGLLQITD
ncbi:MAG TPA: multicopper oxidase domain-containing protein, partial [Aquella sp.]|nr:multicopper oxidase domain-containing protein [Aquella sp.]